MFSTRTPILLIAAGVAGVLAAGAVFTASASHNAQSELGEVRGAVARFHRVEAAMEADWGLVPGLDDCFESEEGGMGIHYIDASRLDTTLDPRRPEALVYNRLPNGNLRLGAVEYIVPAVAWANEGHADPPTMFGEPFHLNSQLGVYVLHAWIFTRNPDGVFKDWNPRVSCPD